MPTGPRSDTAANGHRFLMREETIHFTYIRKIIYKPPLSSFLVCQDDISVAEHFDICRLIVGCF